MFQLDGEVRTYKNSSVDKETMNETTMTGLISCPQDVYNLLHLIWIQCVCARLEKCTIFCA